MPKSMDSFEQEERQRENAINDAWDEGYQEGVRDEHLRHCGWCRQGIECPYKKSGERK